MEIGDTFTTETEIYGDETINVEMVVVAVEEYGDGSVGKKYEMTEESEEKVRDMLEDREYPDGTSQSPTQ